jgi:hypothetical protein
MGMMFWRVLDLALSVPPDGIESPCWVIIGTLVSALGLTAAWGVKEAKEGKKILREWLNETRNQLKLINLVGNANRTGDGDGEQ